MGNKKINFRVAIAIVVVLVAIGLFVRSQSQYMAVKMASEKAKMVFPVWAAQGPFKSGTESAAAMSRASLAVFGPKEAQKYADAIAQHEASFNKKPESWEETRRFALEGANSDAIALGKALKAGHSRRKSK